MSTTRRTVVSVLTAALVASAMSAPAVAQPIDPPAQAQDLRSEAARDPGGHRSTAAIARTDDLRHSGAAGRPPLPGPPTWPADPQPITRAPAAQATDGGDGIDWTTLAPGLAAGLLVLAGIAGVARHSRHVARARISA